MIWINLCCTTELLVTKLIIWQIIWKVTCAMCNDLIGTSAAWKGTAPPALCRPIALNSANVQHTLHSCCDMLKRACWCFSITLFVGWSSLQRSRASQWFASCPMTLQNSINVRSFQEGSCHICIRTTCTESHHTFTVKHPLSCLVNTMTEIAKINKQENEPLKWDRERWLLRNYLS